MRQSIEINQKKLQAIKEERSLFILDVRERSEYNEFNIGGMNVPAHELNEHLDDLQKHTHVVVVCSNGMRSSIVARVLLNKLPETTIYHLSEGIF